MNPLLTTIDLSSIEQGRGGSMESHQAKFRRKIRKEIERLRITAELLEGSEKEEILHLINILEEDHRRSGVEEDYRIQGRERSWASIITLLNRIEQQVNEVHQAIEAEKAWINSQELAQRTVNQFFYDCQEAEKLIKYHGKKGHLTSEQIAALNTQLRSLVRTMVGLFKQSEPLTNAVLQSFETQIFSS
jgi:hypothetical protein